jgi:hypothetical protein
MKLYSVSSGKLATWLLGEYTFQGLEGLQSNADSLGAINGNDGWLN